VQWLRTDPEVVVVTIEPKSTAVPVTRAVRPATLEATPTG
jgi:hypothetical protein